MGAITGRDSNITLFMNLKKQFYLAGQYVEGQIYLNAKTDREYSNLCIKLDGDEHVMWAENHGKNNTAVYVNSYKNYEGHLLIVDFHGKVKKGQYTFPFRFLLPSMMSGSFYISKFCHIKYILKAVLVHQTSQRQNQQYQMFLNILEPPRTPLGVYSLSNTVNSKCCSCCSDYGNISVTLKCDKNFVRNGDYIKVSGLIDNTQGNIRVEQAKITFEQGLFEIASNQTNTKYTQQKCFTLHNVRIPTGPGQVQQFSFSAQIPNQIIDCTAIGRIVSRYFVLHLDTSYGCCANTAQTYLHMIVHSRTPVIVEKKNLTPPIGWNPVIYPTVNCQKMKPFSYNPLPLLPFLNMPGNAEVAVNLNFEQEMGQMQKLINYDLSREYLGETNLQQYNYEPKYYDQSMFSQQQKIQQGYVPYFSNKSESEILKQEK